MAHRSITLSPAGRGLGWGAGAKPETGWITSPQPSRERRGGSAVSRFITLSGEEMGRGGAQVHHPLPRGERDGVRGWGEARGWMDHLTPTLS